MELKDNSIIAELRILKETSSMANIIADNKKSIHIDRLLDNTAQKIIEIMDIPLCTIRIYDEDGKLRLRARAGELKHKVNGDAVYVRPDRRACTFQNKALDVQEYLEQSAAEHVNVLLMGQDKVKYITTLPLKTNEQALGILAVCTRERLEEDKLFILYSLSNMMASAIEKNKLYNDIKNAYLKSVKSLVVAIHAKDAYTQAHSMRVSGYATAIARRLGLAEEEIEEIEITGILHDIGKIGVSDAVLTKPGKLSDEEFQAIQQHPLIGSQILEPIGFSQNIINGALLHHKRYDLKGYPDNIEINELPLIPRIIGAADAYDAMTSNRPYKPAALKEQAVEELRKNAGTQFCPQIVNIMEGLYAENLI